MPLSYADWKKSQSMGAEYQDSIHGILNGQCAIQIGRIIRYQDLTVGAAMDDHDDDLHDKARVQKADANGIWPTCEARPVFQIFCGLCASICVDLVRRIGKISAPSRHTMLGRHAGDCGGVPDATGGRCV